MRIALRCLLLPLAACFAAGAQVDQSLTFDVATVKPAAPPTPGPGGRFFAGGSGGPGSSDPGRVRYAYITMKNLITNAYRVKSYQVSGPAWIDSERYEVIATMPPATTPDEFQVMLRNLLADRFKLKVHRETRELPMYSMTVAKGGLKMKPAEPLAPAPDSAATAPPPMPSGQPKMGPDGFPIFPSQPGRPNNSMIMMPGRAKVTGSQQTLAALATTLTNQLNRPVIDETGLTGKYDYVLTFTPEGMGGMPPPPGGGAGPLPVLPEGDSLPSLPAALQQELGLKLDAKKAPIEVIVVDSGEKAPIEN